MKYTGCGKTYLTVIDSQGHFLFQNILLPCSSFTLYMEDAEGLGIGYSGGSLSVSDSGKTIDTGTVILDDKSIAVASVTPGKRLDRCFGQTTIHIAFSEQRENIDRHSGEHIPEAAGRGNGRRAPSLSIRTEWALTLTPSQDLAGEMLYTVYVTTAVTDGVGRRLQQNFTSTFRTRGQHPAVGIQCITGKRRDRSRPGRRGAHNVYRAC